ncbi:MAG TPA: discoidin domain-containing protein [Polyangia bacterium]
MANHLVEGHVASALVLYREAALLYVAAFVAAGSDQPLADPLQADDVLARFGRLRQRSVVPIDQAALERFFDLVRGGDLLAVDRLDSRSAAEVGLAAQRMVGALAKLVEPRTVSEIRFERGVRLSALGLIVGALLIWVASSILGHINIALHMPVTASGLHPTAKSPPGGLTDGVTTGAYGIHSSISDNPWVQVDLQAVYRIDKVKIYNRGDGWFDDGLPMTLQFSTDGASFADIDTRTTNFGQLIPWTVKARGKTARYVRVRSTKGKYVALSEVEVFGTKP